MDAGLRSVLSTAALLSACLLVASCAAPDMAHLPAEAPHRAGPVARRTVRVEAEDGALTGLAVASEGGGYSGTGYVTGFDLAPDAVTFHVAAHRGLYELRIGYRAPFGTKGFTVQVNAQSGAGLLPGTGRAFAVQSAGRFLLEEGENAITINKGWGWYDVDFIELVPANVGLSLRPAARPADPEAGELARMLYDYLRTVYGRKTLVGQYDFGDIELVKARTGKEPAVGAFDFIDYSPTRREHGADPGGLTERVIEWVRSGGGIVTFSWHWNAPTDLPNAPGREWWSGFYTRATEFELAAALANPASERYRLLLRDMDVVAAELKKLDAAGIPVLWRPLHEASGGWFWWGARGPEPFKELWRLMFRRFTQEHGLHNLLWVYTPCGGEDAAWYPGDEYVDVVAPDVYAQPSDSMSGAWDDVRARYGRRKMVALGESGTVPSPKTAREMGVWWSWFSLWVGVVQRLPDQELRKAYESEDFITRDKLPAWTRGRGK